jgi:hypothetical protein
MSPQTDGAALTPARNVNAVTIKISRLALDIDELVDQLERSHLTDAEAALVGVPTMHLAIVAGRLEQVVHEAQALDQRPRLERLSRAAA